MDPLSFTASLMTVSGVTIMTSKLVYRLRDKVKNAPKDVGDLLEQLQTFQELLEELQAQLQDFQDNTAAQSKLLQIWGQSVAHMQRDVESLHTKLSKLEQLLKKKSLGSRVLLSARQILSEKKVAEYQRKIDTHCGVLTCIKAEVCDQKLSRLTQTAIQLGNENRAGFQTISTQVSQATGQLGAEANAGFSNVSSDLKSAKLASDVMHRALQSRMDDYAHRGDVVRQNVDEIRCKQMRAIEVNEAGFQAVQSALVTAASFNREGHESTHTMLRQQETLMQRLGKQLAFGNSNECVRSPHGRSDEWGSTTPMTTVYWKTLYHSLPIGKLCISIEQTRQCEGSENSASPESTESNIVVTFVPPKWLTCLAVDYRMKLGYNSIGDQWHWGANLRPLTVNQNPFVIDALETVDFEAIQKSFREGLIRPTDYVLCHGRVQHWYTLLKLWPPERINYNIRSLLSYMAEKGLPGQEHLLCQILWSLQAARSPTLTTDMLQNFIRIYYQHGGSLFAGRFHENRNQSSILANISFTYGLSIWKWFSESLLHSAESWTVDELSSFGICLLGTVAQANSGFRTRLRTYVSSYRSPFLAAGTIYADSLFESTFGIASVLSHFHRLDEIESRQFLAALCRAVTPSMLRPFIDTGIDLNDYQNRANMLGNAAAVGNLDIVRMLMERGANGALALTSFIAYGWELSDGLYKYLLELLVENARPTSFNMDGDALTAVIESPRALSAHPKALEILLHQKVFSDELIKNYCKSFNCNYMCMAIRNRLGSVVELLLQHRAYANTTSIWLIVSVEYGAASCTEALIQHGADVNFVNGAGRSALQVARSNVTAPHPRIFSHHKEFYDGYREVTAEEDAETLAVVERAVRLKLQSTDDLTVHEPSCELEPQFLKQSGEAVPAPHNIFEKAFGSLLTYYRRPLLGRYSSCLYYEIGDLWSLSFYEALLMRFFYAVSIILLLALEMIAFVQGRKRIRMPSRTVLSAVALLLLAFIWEARYWSIIDQAGLLAKHSWRA
ncbi:hypothetical protein JMJ35_002555 [Cladonia borealis]|uniref:Fungal N-terminal domain-containing protein n=1 Tax=Cladonia borealis TaxID=184061 RepID=A0AA39R6T5_9LECA|nr:hypothetical protein JMJ35_002555 [Cladonia borealis]